MGEESRRVEALFGLGGDDLRSVLAVTRNERGGEWRRGEGKQTTSVCIFVNSFKTIRKLYMSSWCDDTITSSLLLITHLKLTSRFS